MSVSVWTEDPFDGRRVVGASGLLAAFNEAGVVLAGELHVAQRLGALAGEDNEAVLLAAALAVRGPRLGHVYVDLATAPSETTGESEVPVDVAALPWPEAGGWVACVAGSPVVAAGEADLALRRPLRLAGTRLYVDRYWREELQLAQDLTRLSAPADEVDVDALRAGLARLFAGAEKGDRQRLAAATAVLRRFAVVAGGPGTGKTTTVARIAALLLEQAVARGARRPLIALAAPTGKAAARLEESLHAETARLDVTDGVRDALLGLSSSTLHRLLGWRPDSHSRFRHNRDNRLPHDVVIVDETSMVSLWQMGRLVEAVRPDARLILVGDPGQLTSVEAGAVLGDIVGPARDGLLLGVAARETLASAVGEEIEAREPATGVVVGDGVVVLQQGHRFGGAIAELAAAIDAGDSDAAVGVLASGAEDVVWIQADASEADSGGLAVVRDAAVASARAVTKAATAGDIATALRYLAGFRLLCAHRRGPYGAADWMTMVGRWIATELPEIHIGAEWYLGRPLLVTENDYSLKLYNGDTGVVVASPEGQAVAAFERQGEPTTFSPSRISAVETVYAMTIHKSQGSQFDVAAVILPPAESPILTRELLYTGVTRASDRLIVVGTEDAVRAAVARPAARASGLGERLWK